MFATFQGPRALPNTTRHCEAEGRGSPCWRTTEDMDCHAVIARSESDAAIAMAVGGVIYFEKFNHPI
jgi:hypothetical protein